MKEKLLTYALIISVLSTLGLGTILYFKNSEVNSLEEANAKANEKIVVQISQINGYKEAIEIRDSESESSKKEIENLANNNKALLAANQAKQDLIDDLKNQNTDNNAVTDTIDVAITGGAVSIGEATFKCGKIGDVKVGTEATCGFSIIKTEAGKYMAKISPNARLFDLSTKETILLHKGEIVKHDVIIEPEVVEKIVKVKRPYPKWSVYIGAGLAIPNGGLFAEAGVNYRIMEIKPSGWVTKIMPGKDVEMSWNLKARGKYFINPDITPIDPIDFLDQSNIEFLTTINYSFNTR